MTSKALRSTTRLSLRLRATPPLLLSRPLSTTSALRSPAPSSTANRIFDSVRTPNDLHTLLLLTAASHTPLVTLWGASWCASCRAVKPLVRGLIEDERVGEDEGGVGFVEVELDSPLIEDLGSTYAITSMPTLLAFSRQEPQLDTRVTKIGDMKNKQFLTEWILNEARRRGKGGAGGSWFGS